MRARRVIDSRLMLEEWRYFVEEVSHHDTTTTAILYIPDWPNKELCNLIPRVFSLFKMAAAREKKNLLPSRRHSEKREDPGDEVGSFVRILLHVCYIPFTFPCSSAKVHRKMIIKSSLPRSCFVHELFCDHPEAFNPHCSQLKFPLDHINV